MSMRDRARSDAFQTGEGRLQPDRIDLAERAITWLRDRWGDDKPCPYCGGTEWGVTGPFRLIRESIQGKRQRLAAEPVYECVCRTCGNIVLIDSRFPELR